MNRRSDAMDMKRRMNQKVRGANNTRGSGRFNNRGNQPQDGFENESFDRRRGMPNYNQGPGRRAFSDIQNPGGFTNRDNLTFD